MVNPARKNTDSIKVRVFLLTLVSTLMACSSHDIGSNGTAETDPEKLAGVWIIESRSLGSCDIRLTTKPIKNSYSHEMIVERNGNHGNCIEGIKIRSLVRPNRYLDRLDIWSVDGPHITLSDDERQAVVLSYDEKGAYVMKNRREGSSEDIRMTRK